MSKRLCFIAFISVKFIYCTSLIISFSFYARSQEMAVRVYTAKDGLPSSYVYETYQDKLGYLWIGSPYGLSRFDGRYFTNYGLSDGLPDLRTNCGFMDSRLRFWAGTTRGVAQFKGNRFIRYPLSDSQNVRWVFQIFETSANQVWSLTSVGVYQFNSNKWNKIKLYPGYENHACRNIIETNEGIYINYGDLLVLKKTDGSYKMIGTLKKEGYYYNQMSMSAGEAFISTMDGIYTIKDQQLVKLPGASGRLRDVYVYYRDSKKRMWLGTEKNGIQVMAEGDSVNTKSVYKGTPHNLVQHIAEDKLGNIWVTTGSGLVRISEMGFKFIDIPVIKNGTLFSVFQPPTGPLMINNGSLAMQTFENGIFKVKKLITGIGHHHLNNEMIIDNYAFDNKNRYWYFLRGWLLAMQEGNKLYEQNNQLARLGNEVFDVLFDTFRKKIMVAVGSQKYPCQFNDTSYSPLAVLNKIDVKGSIRHLHQCANGTILFTTDRGFIYSIDQKNICKQQLDEVDSEGEVSRFCNDPNGDVWIIYNGRGLRCYSWQKDALVFKEQLTKKNGLSNDNVSSLCFDNHKNLWVCANSSVTVFSKKTNATKDATYKVISFFDAEDLQLDNAYGTRLIKDLKGNIWLYFGNHLVCFSPDKINYTPPVPSIEIENLKLNLRETNWTGYADSLTGIFQLPYNLTLSHENNTLGIYFKGISSSGTDGIKYSYLLGGLENLWSNPSTDNFVSYVRLPPGKYNFKVKAQLPNTNWSEPAIFSFEIKKAFWQTWWFDILIGLALFTGIYVLFRYRLRQKINLLEMRNRISQDLHDEIGASISGINLLSQMAAEKLRNHETGEAADYLSKVKNYTQDVIEKLSDMVWIFNPQNDSIEKLLQRLKSFTISIAMSKNIKIHFVTDKDNGSINLTIRQRKAIYLISKEAINNMFKYADCKNIFYGFNIKGSKWRLTIQDDGKGFVSLEYNNGNGLKNMQARADEIGAKFQIRSQPGAGTIITLES